MTKYCNILLGDNMKDVKIIFIDLDGTLKDSEGKVSLRTYKIIEKLKELGLYVIFTTGRCIPYTVSFAKRYDSSGFMITSNGAEIYNYTNDNLLYHSPIKRENLKFVDGLVEKYNLKFIANTKDIRYSNTEENITGRKLIDKLYDIKAEVNQVVIQSTDINSMKFFRRDLGECPELKISNKSSKIEGRKYLFYDVTNSEVSKGDAIVRLCNHLGISMDHTMAIGDSGNDIEMFNVCKYKVAVANADKELKDIANLETLSNDQDGVAIVLERLYDEIIK